MNVFPQSGGLVRVVRVWVSVVLSSVSNCIVLYLYIYTALLEVHTKSEALPVRKTQREVRETQREGSSREQMRTTRSLFSQELVDSVQLLVNKEFFHQFSCYLSSISFSYPASAYAVSNIQQDLFFRSSFPLARNRFINLGSHYTELLRQSGF